ARQSRHERGGDRQRATEAQELPPAKGQPGVEERSAPARGFKAEGVHHLRLLRETHALYPLSAPRCTERPTRGRRADHAILWQPACRVGRITLRPSPLAPSACRPEPPNPGGSPCSASPPSLS